MVSGIAILSVSILSLGAFLIRTAVPKTLTDEVKEAVKKRVGNIENLTQEEVEDYFGFKDFHRSFCDFGNCDHHDHA